ncbi:hypothetical protein FNV43_RR19381 [Rhamnella rubrinervis]|uniref:Uncharacterized protein n=1 Tax=Rhamnella rubrinervis TaxID=2594499 RepID=A0A8K0DZH8_9ROSA|nr:hypothetical protein FNV43_RR19381 [Rhamnella rubrinervis]
MERNTRLSKVAGTKSVAIGLGKMLAPLFCIIILFLGLHYHDNLWLKRRIKSTSLLCPTMRLCVLLPFVRDFFTYCTSCQTALYTYYAAVTIDRSECSILSRRAAALKSNRALSLNGKSSGDSPFT